MTGSLFLPALKCLRRGQRTAKETWYRYFQFQKAVRWRPNKMHLAAPAAVSRLTSTTGTMTRLQNSSRMLRAAVNLGERAIGRLISEVREGLRHGYFDYTVSCEVIGEG